MALICVVARLANRHELFAAPRRLASEAIAPETRLMWDLFRGSLSAGARLSRKRALRAAADAPARSGDRDAGRADGARGRVTSIRGGDGARLLIVAQAA